MDLRPPEYMALVNPIACNAFAMRFESRTDRAIPMTLSGMDPEAEVLFDQETSVSVCDAEMLIAPYLKVVTPLPPRVAAHLLTARLTLEVDGEIVVAGEYVERFLLKPPFSGVGYSEKDPKVSVGLKTEADLLGTCKLNFLPNRSRVIIRLTKLPKYDGPVEIVLGVMLSRYTTKAKTGCLFGVAALDEHQAAAPITYSWQGAEGVAGRLGTAGAGGAHVPLSSENLDVQRAHLLGQALREEERIRAMRRDAEETVLFMKAQAAAAAAAPPPPPPPAPKGYVEEPPMPSIEDQVERAKGRLIRWGIYATITMATVAGTLLLAYRYLKAFLP